MEIRTVCVLLHVSRWMFDESLELDDHIGASSTILENHVTTEHAKAFASDTATNHASDAEAKRFS